MSRKNSELRTKQDPVHTNYYAMTHSQIANLLGCSKQNIKQTEDRALAKIRLYNPKLLSQLQSLLQERILLGGQRVEIEHRF